MNFKKRKEDVLVEIQRRAEASISSDLYNMNMRMDTSSFAYQLQTAIGKAIAEGFKVMMENTYSDQEFEKDIGIRS